MFTDDESTMVVTIVNVRQVPEFLSFLKKTPGHFRLLYGCDGSKREFSLAKGRKGKMIFFDFDYK